MLCFNFTFHDQDSKLFGDFDEWTTPIVVTNSQKQQLKQKFEQLHTQNSIGKNQLLRQVRHVLSVWHCCCMPEAINAAIFTEMYIPYNENADTDSLTFGDFGPYTFDDPLRQHLHLFLVNLRC